MLIPTTKSSKKCSTEYYKKVCATLTFPTSKLIWTSTIFTLLIITLAQVSRHFTPIFLTSMHIYRWPQRVIYQFLLEVQVEKGTLKLREIRTTMITYPKKSVGWMSQQYHMYCKYFMLKQWHGYVNNDWVVQFHILKIWRCIILVRWKQLPCQALVCWSISCFPTNNRHNGIGNSSCRYRPTAQNLYLIWKAIHRNRIIYGLSIRFTGTVDSIVRFGTNRKWCWIINKRWC